MPDLIAQGPQPEQRWRRKLIPGKHQTIGREAGDWSVPWDERISRQHVEVEYKDGRLRVEKFEAAKNPVFYEGQNTPLFRVKPGEHFVIGNTTFTLNDQRAIATLDLPRPAGQQTFSAVELRRRPFRESDTRIDALSRLPEIVSGSVSDEELFTRLVNLLLRGIDRASAAAVVTVQGPKSKVQSWEREAGAQSTPQSAIRNPQSAIAILHWDRRLLAEADFEPSERLIRQAVESGESVVHVWAKHPHPRPLPKGEGDAQQRPGDAEDVTVSESIDWALCSPVPGKCCGGLALYVTGSFGNELRPARDDAELLRDDVKFAEVVATTVGGLRESQFLAARQASLGQFFSPNVLEAIGGENLQTALTPREADVTVLFCDLRGFSRESERSADDLYDLLDRVSRALGVMTHHILAEGGVIGDFHGDAAMGFWGWPIAQDDAIGRACRAALGIARAFQDSRNGTGDKEQGTECGSSFRVGIGIASGRAVAGSIGTEHQVKVTVFGPVVNLAARLETMTRQIGASILIDPATAAAARDHAKDICRVRRVANVVPVGFARPVEISELLPRAGDGPQLSDEALAIYEHALSAFITGKWEQSLEDLAQLPADDQAAAFLERFMGRHAGTPPAHWDGAIRLEGK
jgi:adenylate cyclase